MNKESNLIAGAMTLKNLFASALLAAAPAFAHPGHKDVVPQGPLYRRNLDHCAWKFEEPEFVKRTVEVHGAEIARLRQRLGIREK